MSNVKKFRIKSYKNNKSILKLNKISLKYGRKIILDNLNLQLNNGQILGLLGPNGVGKSTIFNLITGLLKPDFGINPPAQKVNVDDKDFEVLDFLLWKWKGYLSREWYPFIFGLKQDLQISQKLLTSERKIKTQTAPLSEFLLKGELE